MWTHKFPLLCTNTPLHNFHSILTLINIESSKGKATGPSQVLKELCKTEGLKGPFKGLTAMLWRCAQFSLHISPFPFHVNFRFISSIQRRYTIRTIYAHLWVFGRTTVKWIRCERKAHTKWWYWSHSHGNCRCCGWNGNRLHLQISRGECSSCFSLFSIGFMAAGHTFRCDKNSDDDWEWSDEISECLALFQCYCKSK